MVMNTKNSKIVFLIGVSGAIGCILASNAFSQQPLVNEQGGVTTITFPDRSRQMADEGIDYKNAKPTPLPSAKAPFPGFSILDSNQIYLGEPSYSPGGQGDGKQNPKVLIPQSELQELQDPNGEANNPDATPYLNGAEPYEYGTSNLPYATSRVDALIGTTLVNQTSKFPPFRPAGKLFFSKTGTDSYICSASLIKRGVVVTAAHCVSEFGKNRFYSKIQFIPAYYNGVAPYGVWTAKSVRVMTSYLNGTDPCYQKGVICQNDVAVITLNAKTNPTYPGTSTGWYGYGANGYGFTTNKEAQISQLGYPASHDGGGLMQRTDSLGFIYAPYANNTLIGSRQTGGSSGGPWLVNLGIPATLSGTGYGASAAYNIVVGTTSWQSSTTVKLMGASPFLSTNIVPLVSAACTATPAACQ